MRLFFLLSFSFYVNSIYAQVHPDLQKVADRYNPELMFSQYALQSFAEYELEQKQILSDYEILQQLPETEKHSLLYLNLHFFLNDKIQKDKNCQPYYWDPDRLMGLQQGLNFSEIVGFVPALVDFEKIVDEQFLLSRKQIDNLRERFQFVIDHSKTLTETSLIQILSMFADPEFRMGLQSFEKNLPTLSCSYCQQIDIEKLKTRFDSEIAPLFFDIQKLANQIYLTAEVGTPLSVPMAVRRPCYNNILTGIYSDLTPSMILKKGESELLRAEREMLVALSQLGLPPAPPLSISAYIEKAYKEMANSNKYQVPADAVSYQKIYEELYQRVKSHLSEITSYQDVVPLTYAFNFAEGNPKMAFFNYDEANKKGVFTTFNPLKGGHLNFELVGLFFHEGLPGHCLQFPLSSQISEKASNAFDKFKFFSAFTEGWGLYAEELMLDLNLYQTPEEKFAFYDLLRLRALRLTNAYHYFYDNWENSQTTLNTNTHLFGTSKNASDAIERAKQWDGQGVGYLVGKTVFMSLRSSSQKILGACFSLPEFHDSFLFKSNMHLDTLVVTTADWLQKHPCYKGKQSVEEIEKELRQDIRAQF